MRLRMCLLFRRVPIGQHWLPDTSWICRFSCSPTRSSFASRRPASPRLFSYVRSSSCRCSAWRPFKMLSSLALTCLTIWCKCSRNSSSNVSLLLLVVCMFMLRTRKTNWKAGLKELDDTPPLFEFWISYSIANLRLFFLEKYQIWSKNV